MCGDRTNSCVVGPTVRLQKIHSSPSISLSTPSQVRAALGYTDSDFLVLHLGTVCNRKGQIYSAQACAELMTADPNMKLLIVGARYIRDHEIAYIKKVTEVVTSRGLSCGRFEELRKKTVSVGPTGSVVEEVSTTEPGEEKAGNEDEKSRSSDGGEVSSSSSEDGARTEEWVDEAPPRVGQETASSKNTSTSTMTTTRIFFARVVH